MLGSVAGMLPAAAACCTGQLHLRKSPLSWRAQAEAPGRRLTPRVAGRARLKSPGCQQPAVEVQIQEADEEEFGMSMDISTHRYRHDSL